MTAFPAVTIVVSILALAALVVVATTPQLLGSRRSAQALDASAAAPTTAGLLAAAVSVRRRVRVHRVSPGARRSPPSAARISPRDGAARFGVGCAREHVRARQARRRGQGRALLARARGAGPALDGGRRLRGAVGAPARSRSRCSSSPPRPRARCRSGPCSCSAAWSRVVGGRRARRALARATTRIAHLLDGFAALARSPRRRRGARLDARHVACRARRGRRGRGRARRCRTRCSRRSSSSRRSTLAAAFPLTPGNVGVASGAVAVALAEPRDRHVAGARRRHRDPGASRRSSASPPARSARSASPARPSRAPLDARGAARSAARRARARRRCSLLSLDVDATSRAGTRRLEHARRCARRRAVDERAPRRPRHLAEPGRDDRHPHLARQPLVDRRAEDDVRVVGRRLRARPPRPRSPRRATGRRRRRSRAGCRARR